MPATTERELITRELPLAAPQPPTTDIGREHEFYVLLWDEMDRLYSHQPTEPFQPTETQPQPQEANHNNPTID